MKIRTFITGACALLLLLLPLTVAAQNIQVDPMTWDYGEVELGASEPMSFTITSMGPDTKLRIDGIALADNESGAYEITSITPEPVYPMYLEVGETAEVVVTFAPGAVGVETASLFILSNAHNDPTFYVPLQGEGIINEPTPGEMMEDLIDTFGDCVENETLFGIGQGNSVASHLRVFAGMLDAADDLIEIGDLDGACRPLDHAYGKSDGLAQPPDFVAGQCVTTINAMIGEVMEALECEE